MLAGARSAPPGSSALLDATADLSRFISLQRHPVPMTTIMSKIINEWIQHIHIRPCFCRISQELPIVQLLFVLFCFLKSFQERESTRVRARRVEY
jgi:hypothetical protein